MSKWTCRGCGKEIDSIGLVGSPDVDRDHQSNCLVERLKGALDVLRYLVYWDSRLETIGLRGGDRDSYDRIIAQAKMELRLDPHLLTKEQFEHLEAVFLKALSNAEKLPKLASWETKGGVKVEVFDGPNTPPSE